MTDSASSIVEESEQIKLAAALGQQVRTFRNAMSLTVVDCAKRTSLSPAMLSKIENGHASPSLATLHALSRTFNVPLTAFFRKYEEQQDVCYTPAGAGLNIERHGSHVGHQYQLLGHGVGKELSVAPHLISLTDESEVFPQFQHSGVEFIYMLEGEVVYQHAEEHYRLQPGDSLFFEADTPHGPAELVDLPIRFLSVIVQQRGER